MSMGSFFNFLGDKSREEGSHSKPRRSCLSKPPPGIPRTMSSSEDYGHDSFPARQYSDLRITRQVSSDECGGGYAKDSFANHSSSSASSAKHTEKIETSPRRVDSSHRLESRFEGSMKLDTRNRVGTSHRVDSPRRAKSRQSSLLVYAELERKDDEIAALRQQVEQLRGQVDACLDKNDHTQAEADAVTEHLRKANSTLTAKLSRLQSILMRHDLRIDEDQRESGDTTYTRHRNPRKGKFAPPRSERTIEALRLKYCKRSLLSEDAEIFAASITRLNAVADGHLWFPEQLNSSGVPKRIPFYLPILFLANGVLLVRVKSAKAIGPIEITDFDTQLETTFYAYDSGEWAMFADDVVSGYFPEFYKHNFVDGVWLKMLCQLDLYYTVDSGDGGRSKTNWTQVPAVQDFLSRFQHAGQKCSRETHHDSFGQTLADQPSVEGVSVEGASVEDEASVEEASIDRAPASAERASPSREQDLTFKLPRSVLSETHPDDDISLTRSYSDAEKGGQGMIKTQVSSSTKDSPDSSPSTMGRDGKIEDLRHRPTKP